MNTLQEAALTALAFIRWNEFGECRTPGFQGPTPTAAEAADALEDALAQQELPQKERTDFMAGYDAGMADAKRMAQQGEPVAYLTQTEQGDMVWTTDTYAEACTYCDDGEFPVPLYKSAQPVASVPLTDKKLKDMWLRYCGYPGGIFDFARAVETTHGIKEVK